MTTETINQSYLFLIFILIGIVIGVLFDIFRVLRKSFKTNNMITYIEDILFWLLSGCVLIYSIFVFNNGEIRGYIFLAIILGILIYMCSISNFFCKTSIVIIDCIKNIIIKVIKIIKVPILFIIKGIKIPISFIYINLHNKKPKILKKLTKNDKHKKEFKIKCRNI